MKEEISSKIMAIPEEEMPAHKAAIGLFTGKAGKTKSIRQNTLKICQMLLIPGITLLSMGKVPLLNKSMPLLMGMMFLSEGSILLSVGALPSLNKALALTMGTVPLSKVSYELEKVLHELEKVSPLLNSNL
jgi:hypothetical protein